MPQLRLEVQADPAGLPNLIKNPSGELGAWGYVTPVANTKMGAGTEVAGPYLTFTTTATQVIHLHSELLPVAAGQYVAARIDWRGQVGAGTGYYRMRLEFYTAAGALISSSAYGSYQNAATAATVYVPSALAPATTAYVRLRIQFSASNVSDTNTPAGRVFSFRRVMVTKAATSAAIGSERRNLVRNPSFEVNTTGWSAGMLGTNTTGTNLVSISRPNDAGAYPGPSYLRSSLAAGNALPLGIRISNAGPSGALNVQEGRDLAVSIRVKGGAGAGATVRIWWQWKTTGGSIIGTETGQTWALPGAWTRLGLVRTAPSGAGGLNLLIELDDGTANPKFIDVDAVLVEHRSDLPTDADYFDGARADAGGVDYAWQGTAHDSESTAASGSTSWAYVEPIEWRNIIGPTISLQADRKALDASTLTGQVRDATLDPAVSDAVRPGRYCRLTAKGVGATYRPVITTKLLRADATYDKRKTDPLGQVRTNVNLAGADNAQALANQAERRGVATLAELPYLLEGAGVPWNVAGSGDQVISAAVVSTNDNASLLDQVAIVRDTVRAHAYVSAAGQLVVTAAPAASGVTFADDDLAVSFTGVDVGFSTDECVNHVLVKWLRYDPTTDKTEEVTYGPYEDADSIGIWGVHSRTFTIHGAAEDPGTIAAYAAAVLAANKTPQVKVRTLTVNVNSEQLVDAVLDAELTETVTIDYAGTAYSCRVAAVSHRITAKRWTATFTFDQAATVAQPTVVPRPEAAEQTNYAGGCKVTTVGGWAASPPPNSTTGLPFTVRGGVFRGWVHATAYSPSSGAAITCAAYIDGILVGHCRLNPSLPANAHIELHPCPVEITLAPGTHYFHLQQTAGLSDAGDYVSLVGVVTDK